MDNGIKITIGTTEYLVKKSYRSLLLFEELASKSSGEIKESVNDLLMLFYCMLKASNKEKFNKSFDEFLDMLDDEPIAVELFNEYLEEIGKVEAAKNPKTTAKKKQKNQ